MSISNFLDAFLALNERNSHVFIHEHRERPCADEVVAWAKTNGVRINAGARTSDHRTYEEWNLYIGDSTLSFFPLEMRFTCVSEDLRERAEEIRAKANEEIRSLLGETVEVAP